MDATPLKAHALDYNSMEEWDLSPLMRPQQDQEKEGRIQADSDVGCGCNFKVAITMSQESSPSTAHVEHREKKLLCGNNIPATFEEKKNKIATLGKRFTKIYMRK